MPAAEIEQAYHCLMAADPATLPKASDLRVAVVCDLFLDFSQRHHTKDTCRGYQDFLQDFCELYGTLLANTHKQCAVVGDIMEVIPRLRLRDLLLAYHNQAKTST
jgi:hypothetical protein